MLNFRFHVLSVSYLKMPKRRNSGRIEDSDDDLRIFAERRAEKKAQLEDSDDDKPLFGPNGLAEKIRQQEEEQESQQPLSPEDFLKQEVGLSHEELNLVAVEEADLRLGVAASLASTPSRNEYEVSRSFQDDDEIARKAAAKMTRFEGKAKLRVTK
jgi:hypothetical protein